MRLTDETATDDRELNMDVSVQLHLSVRNVTISSLTAGKFVIINIKKWSSKHKTEGYERAHNLDIDT